MNQTKKGVVVILEDGTIIEKYFYGDETHHDDILWNILSDNKIIPDNYKKLTSKDLTFKHEFSSVGREGLIAASNGMAVIFIVYDNEDMNAIIYLPFSMSQQQYNSLNTKLIKIENENLHNSYFAGIIPEGLHYDEINDNNYIPDFFDEISFASFDELTKYIEFRKNKKT